MIFTLHLREECAKEAFQLWLDAKREQPCKVVAIRTGDQCRIEVDLEDTPT